MRTAPAVTFVLAAMLAWSAQAAEFRTVAEGAAVMYDAPSKAATPVYVASRYYPVQVVVNLDAWVKVRDHTGTLSWVEKKALTEKRMVIVTAPTVDIRGRADDAAPLAFQATQNVALELVEILPENWLRVRHLDGATGFVRSGLVWGY